MASCEITGTPFASTLKRNDDSLVEGANTLLIDGLMTSRMGEVIGRE